MATLNDTAYPRLSKQFSLLTLRKLYLPTDEERRWLNSLSYSDSGKLEAATLLKCFQRLGYFPSRQDIPERLIDFVRQSLFGERSVSLSLSKRHARRIKDQIRTHLDIKMFNAATDGQRLFQFACDMAVTKENTVDIINAMIDQLVHDSFELPAFSTLNRMAIRARAQSLNAIYADVCSALKRSARKRLKQLLREKNEEGFTRWNAIKLQPKKPTAQQIRSFIAHAQWLSALQTDIGTIPDIPEQIRLQCILEARAFSADRIRHLKADKRDCLMAILINEQRLYANDSLVDMLIKDLRKTHNTARKAHQAYQLSSVSEASSLVRLLRDVAVACIDDNNVTTTDIKNILGDKPEMIVERCDKLVQGGIDSYLHFLPIRYRHANRKLLLDLLATVDIRAIARNNPLYACLRFLLTHRHAQFHSIMVRAVAEDAGVSASELFTWVPRAWLKLLFQNDAVQLRNRTLQPRWFELCVLTEVSRQLRSGDLYIENSIKYDDYRNHLVDRKTFKVERDAYCEQSGVSPSASEFVNHLKATFDTIARELDAKLSGDEQLVSDNGRISLKRAARKTLPNGFDRIESAVKSEIPDISIVDLLVDTVKWIDLKPYFKPLSGHQGKIAEFDRRLVATLFCYGCNLGPTQTARCLDGISKRQIAYINLSSTSEQNLVDATEQVINAYNKYDLPGYWGSGNSASVDGTRFDMYEQNMLSEYHVRYASYGGVGYYLVSDKYIALFSRFIPCGVREAIHLIDGLMENTSDIQPNSIHGDTHAQSTVVFGLAHLLGIKLMPRIKDINSLIFFKPDRRVVYEHIEALFADGINFNLIRDNYQEMLRVAVSIKLGRVSASTIVRRLGTEGIRNNLFYAFRELGRVVRTQYLLEYIGNIDLRETVNASTCKSEEFNNFLKWVFFFNNGTIQENLRHEQSKLVKFNHLVANLIILHNVNARTKAIRKLQNDGTEMTPEILNGFSPYGTSHVNLLGLFELNTKRRAISRTYTLMT